MRSSRVAIGVLALVVALSTGCMSSKKRRAPDPAPEEVAAETAEGYAAVVTARSLNIRGGPGADQPVTGKLLKGARVHVLEEQGDWRRVQTADDGSEGWVSGAYLKAE